MRQRLRLSQTKMKISFFYSDGDEESVILNDTQANRELVAFLNRFSDSGKKQWMSKMKNKDYPTPLQDAHYQDLVRRMEEKY